MLAIATTLVTKLTTDTTSARRAVLRSTAGDASSAATDTYPPLDIALAPARLPADEGRYQHGVPRARLGHHGPHRLAAH